MYEDERKHWITTCCRNGKVEVYDSCFTGSLSPSIREMLVRLYRPFLRDDCLVVTMKPIPQQKGASDCGLFAISAAFQSAAGLRSSTLMQEKLRQHVEEHHHNISSILLDPKLTCDKGHDTKTGRPGQTRVRRYVLSVP